MNNNQNKQGVFSQIAAAAGTFTGTATAKYRSYLERENEKFRAEQAQIRAQQAEAAYLAEIYPRIATYLMVAVQNTARITQIIPTNLLENLYAAVKVKRFGDGTECLRYRAWGNVGIPLSAEKTIQKIIQRELDELTAQNGFFPLDALVELRPFNEVIFLVRFRVTAKQGVKK